MAMLTSDCVDLHIISDFVNYYDILPMLLWWLVFVDKRGSAILGATKICDEFRYLQFWLFCDTVWIPRHR